MKGDLVCQECGSYGLQVVYIRVSVGEQRSYGEGRRKQAWKKFGVWCDRCGFIFLEDLIWSDYKAKIKASFKNNWHFKKPSKIPKIKLFIPHKRNWMSDKVYRVKE